MSPEKAHMLHTVAWVLGLVDVILVAVTMVLESGGH